MGGGSPTRTLAKHVPGAVGHAEDHRAQIASQPADRRLDRPRGGSGGGGGVGGGFAVWRLQVDAGFHCVVRL